MTPEQLLEDAKAAYLLKQRTVFANPHDGGMRAALRVAIEAAAKAVESVPRGFGINEDGQTWLTQPTKQDFAAAIRAILPTEETP
jgi:hypothetical protein